MKSVVSFVFAFCLASSTGLLRAQRPALDVHLVGDYGFCPWAGAATALSGPPETWTETQRSSRLHRLREMNFGIRNIWVRDEKAMAALDMSPICKEVEEGWQYAPKRTMLIRIDFWDNNGRARFEGPTQPPGFYWERLAKVLLQLEPVMDKLQGISLSEENTINVEERLTILQFLYEQTKLKYPGLTVFQWLTPDLSVPKRFYGKLLSADGWIIDPYGVGGPRYPKGPSLKWLVQKYLVTGKPLVFVPNASNQKVLRDLFFINSKEHLQICEDFNLPTVFYWTYTRENATRSTTLFGYPTHDPVMDEISERVFAWRKRTSELPQDYSGNAAVADVWETPPRSLRVHPGLALYKDDFSESRFLSESSGEGFRDLLWDGERLLAHGFRGRETSAALRYRFESDKPMREPAIVLKGKTDAALNGSIRISASADEGKSWVAQTGLTLPTRNLPQFKEVSKLWVTVKLEGKPGSASRPPVSIDELAISDGDAPPESAAIVTNYFDDSFSKEKFRHHGKTWAAPLGDSLNTLTPLIYFSAEICRTGSAAPFSCTLRNEKSRTNTGIGFSIAAGPDPKLVVITGKSLQGVETGCVIENGRKYRIEIEANGLTHLSNVYVRQEGEASRRMVAEKVPWDNPNRLVHELALVSSGNLDGLALEHLAVWSVSQFPVLRDWPTAAPR